MALNDKETKLQRILCSETDFIHRFSSKGASDLFECWAMESIRRNKPIEEIYFKYLGELGYDVAHLYGGRL